MSTQPSPQQLQLARRVPEIQVLGLRDPPGRIATTRERSHTAQYPPHPYPLDKSSIALFYNLDENWVDASQEVLIFTHQVPESDDEKVRLLDKKSEHFQFYFWTALDRARRLNKPLDGSVRLWEYHDLPGMLIWWRKCLRHPLPTYIGESNDGLWKDVLLSSPWFDCPVFYDLLWEVVPDFEGQPRTDTEGKVMVKERNSKPAGLEEQFFERWRLTASRLPLRRGENGDAVLPITMEYYQAQYGTAGMEWHMPPTDWAEQGGDLLDDVDE
ncbi:Hypothetical protein NCS54_00487600 [Fusarium falciforme]|uniref:Hypothetical protein n=1 Tax=Fusarium falciforme TaxID=195108 RepID=UPI002301C50B|nr:Hypothetical protein NCS54_00487600 [Fusarium falciforme]WAO87563.1 Hypothetical protein NCS54_00487600 [Fusarium falciforme]